MKLKKFNVSKKILLISVLSASSLTAPSMASAADWICSGTDSWSSSSCWWEGIAPGFMDSANAYVSDNSDVTIDYTGNVNSGVQLSDIFLNNSASGSLVFNRNEDLDLNAYLAVFGTNGQTTVNHSQGSSTFLDAVIGSGFTSTANYNLSGTASINSSGFTVGNEGTGNMLQTGGSLTVTDTLSLGHEAGSNGNYNLTGGTLTVLGAEYVGFFGDSLFTQSGGLHTVQNLHVGRKSGNGTYVMNQGSLQVTGVMEVGTIPGAPGSTTQQATVIQNGGDVELTTPGSKLTVSASGMANGRYELNGGTLTATSIYNNDTFEHNGGTINATIVNNDSFTFGGSGTRTINGDFINTGSSTFEHIYREGSPTEETIQRTTNGSIRLEDGTLININGNIVLEEGGVLDIELGTNFFNTPDIAWITVADTATIGGTLDLTDIGDFDPQSFDTWTILQASLVYGEFSDVLFPVLPDWTWDLVYGTDNITLSGVSAVPVPAAFWLFASGIVGLVGVSRRPKK